MKSIRKILFVMAALAAVFGFVACSNDDDEPSTVAVYEWKYTWKEGDVECYSIYTVTFYDDNTYTVTSVYKDDEDSWNHTVQKGVYTGDPSKDGTIKMTAKKVDWGDNGELIDVPEEDKENYTDIEITISGGTATIDGDKYTKK